MSLPAAQIQSTHPSDQEHGVATVKLALVHVFGDHRPAALETCRIPHCCDNLYAFVPHSPNVMMIGDMVGEAGLPIS
jgi:hypothetical protein